MNSDSGSTLFAGSSPNFSHFMKLCEEIRITKQEYESKITLQISILPE